MQVGSKDECALAAFSELDYIVLALVGEGINSGYAVRRHIPSMGRGRWSADSGSVYRVLRRLQVQKLVEVLCKTGVPNRERTEYKLTALGEAIIARWLNEAPAQDDIEFLLDALRTRSYFLNRLAPDNRARAVKRWMNLNRRLIASLESERANHLTGPSLWVHENMLEMANARQSWLKRMYAELKGNR